MQIHVLIKKIKRTEHTWTLTSLFKHYNVQVTIDILYIFMYHVFILYLFTRSNFP